MDRPVLDIGEQARAALTRGSKIDAIKLVREEHRLGLKEAKEEVERYIDANPDIRSSMHAANAGTARGSIGWILGFAALATLAWYLVRG